MRDNFALPDEIDYHKDCKGNESNFVHTLNLAFIKDFVLTKPLCEGQPVEIAYRKDPDNKFMVFWHVITKDNQSSEHRELNISRAQRLPWIKALIEAVPAPHLKYWRYKEGSGKIRRYIWDESQNYVVVLEDKKDRLYLVTAFNVDSSWKKDDLAKKYKKRIC